MGGAAMPKPPTNKTRTQPGLGSSNGLPRMDSAEMKRVRDTFRGEDAPASTPAPESTPAPRRVRDSVRREEDPEPASVPPRSDRPSARKTASWEPEATTGTRRKARSARPPVTVDDVGAAAVKLARTTRRESAPKLLASRALIAKAPIDTRAAFVLSLIDGRNTVDAIVDMSGMPEDEVKAILDRLARLGLIALP
ncbi:MAG: hypothetical protein KF764_28375 [Labilithrix sp.]|nr:hypothetical protein [Labilithrix sp.]MBX3224014.1 hypothetical protein [Labilithrix sp.]